MSLSVVAVVMAAVAPAAQAGKTVDRFIGGAFGSAEGQFSQPRGVAVNESTGDIYVAEGISAVHRISRYSSAGAFELMWGRGVDDGSAAAQICTAATTPCQGGGTGATAGEFNTPVGLAIDQSDGSLYVHDMANRRVQKFDADGEFTLMFGKGVNQTTGGDVCTAASGNACQAGTAGVAAGQIGNGSTSSAAGRTYLAVHPVTGDVFLADPGPSSGSAQNRRVMQWDSSGNFVRAWGFGVDTGAAAFEVCTTVSGCQGAVTAAGADNGRFGSGQPRHLAVDADGIVYVSDSNQSQRIMRFDADGFADPAGALLAAIVADDQTPAGPLLSGTGSNGTTGLAIHPTSGNLLVVRHRPGNGETLIQEVDTATLTEVDRHAVGAGLTTVQGLAVDAARNRLIVSYAATPPGHGFFVLDDDGPSAPEVTLLPASDVDARSALLHGTINPNGFAEYVFEVSTDGDSWEPVGGGTLVGVGDIDVSATAEGLTPNTPYRMRLRTTSILGGDANGPVPTFEVLSLEGNVVTDAVPADATTVTASSIGTTGALLVGRVNPNGSETTYHFEYGPTTAYGSTIPFPSAFVGSGTAEQLVFQQLTGLLPATTYHFRIVADNGVGGPQFGADRTFTTKAPGGAGAPPSRGYELVSPADKVGGQGIGMWYNGPPAAVGSAFPAHEGERTTLHAGLGGTLSGDAATAYASDMVFSERAGDSVGWQSHSPMTHPASGAQKYRFLLLDAAAADLSKVTLTTNAGLLRFFPEQADWPENELEWARMIGDWRGRWEIFGPTDLSQVAGAGNADAATLVSADGSHVVGATEMRGLAGLDDPALDQDDGRSVYVHDSRAGLSDDFPGDGVRTLVNACTDDTMIPNRVETSPGVFKLDEQACAEPAPSRDAALISGRGADIRGRALDSSTTNLVSRDGSRVFFLAPDPDTSVIPSGGPNGATACATSYIVFSPSFQFKSGVGPDTECPPQLYVRERQGDGSFETRWISRAEDGLFGSQNASLLGPMRFEAATPDGDKVLFRTNSPLTADDPNGAGSPPPGGVTTGVASNSSWDVYLYDLESDELTRVSGGPDGEGDCNSPVNSPVGGDRPAVRFASDDLTRVYFVCAAPLDGAVVADNGTITAPAGSQSASDQANLYLYDANRPPAERWRFVARLPRSSSGDNLNACASTGSVPSGLLARSNEDSSLPDIIDATNCVRGTADGAFATFFTGGRLTADDPDSTSGDIYGFDAEADELNRITRPQGGPGGAYVCWDDNVVGPTPVQLVCNGDPGFGDPGIEMPIGLAPLGVVTDPVDGERIAFFQSKGRLVAEDDDGAYDVYQWRDGELSLVSTGGSDRDGAFYMGNDRQGRNVYFATRDALTWQDHDAVLDLYTARVGGGIPQPPAPALCGAVAGGCQGSADAPAAAVPPPLSAAPAPVESGDASPGVRARLAVGRVGRKARRRAARTGVIRLRVRTNAEGRVRVVARARVARKRRVVARGGARAGEAGRVVVGLRLSRVARRHLLAGRGLRVAVRVGMAGARQRTTTVLLRGPGR